MIGRFFASLREQQNIWAETILYAKISYVSDHVRSFPSVVIMLVHLTLNFWPMRIHEDLLILIDMSKE